MINLLKEMRRKRSPRKERIYEGYIRIKEALGKRPPYGEVHLYGNENSRESRQAMVDIFRFYMDEMSNLIRKLEFIKSIWHGCKS